MRKKDVLQHDLKLREEWAADELVATTFFKFHRIITTESFRRRIQVDRERYAQDSDRAMTLWDSALREREKVTERERQQWEEMVEMEKAEKESARVTFESFRIALVAQAEHCHLLQVLSCRVGVSFTL